MEVYADPQGADHCLATPTSQYCTCSHTKGVCWFHHDEFSVFPPVHEVYTQTVFIAWRYANNAVLGRYVASSNTVTNEKALYLWVHDILGQEALPPITGSHVPVGGVVYESHMVRGY